MDPKLGRYIEPIQLFKYPPGPTSWTQLGPYVGPTERHTHRYGAHLAHLIFQTTDLSTSVQPRTAADKVKEEEESKSDKDCVFTHKKNPRLESTEKVEGFLKACFHHPPLFYSTFLLPSLM